MKTTCLIAIRATVFLAVGSEHGLGAAMDDIEERLRREAGFGRDAAPRPIIVPGVSVEMAVFYREPPDHN
jgi:hypothetical protein